jgi:hypothetical protein
MSIQLFGVDDISNRQDLKLRQTSASSRMYREQDRPGNATADKADVAQDLDESKKEEAVKAALVQQRRVRRFEQGLYPVEPAIGKCGYGCSRTSGVSTQRWLQGIEVGTDSG